MIKPDCIAIAVSTMYRQDLAFLSQIFPGTLLKSLNILVINQTDESRILESATPNIKVINSFERGLAKSRNLAIANIKQEYAVLTDDDVIFDEALAEKINRGFTKFPAAAVIRFRAQKAAGVFFSKYPQHPVSQLSLFGRLNVSSIELAINVKKLKEKQAWFDENFGLGATFGNALEQAFLDNVYKKKLQIAFYPETIVSHPDDCSGRDPKVDKFYYVNGALAQKMFGSLAVCWAFVFFFFQVKQKKLSFSHIRHAFIIYRKGSRDYIKIK